MDYGLRDCFQFCNNRRFLRQIENLLSTNIRGSHKTEISNERIVSKNSHRTYHYQSMPLSNDGKRIYVEGYEVASSITQKSLPLEQEYEKKQIPNETNDDYAPKDKLHDVKQKEERQIRAYKKLKALINKNLLEREFTKPSSQQSPPPTSQSVTIDPWPQHSVDDKQLKAPIKNSTFNLRALLRCCHEVNVDDFSIADDEYQLVERAYCGDKTLVQPERNDRRRSLLSLLQFGSGKRLHCNNVTVPNSETYEELEEEDTEDETTNYSDETGVGYDFPEPPKDATEEDMIRFYWEIAYGENYKEIMESLEKKQEMMSITPAKSWLVLLVFFLYLPFPCQSFNSLYFVSLSTKKISNCNPEKINKCQPERSQFFRGEPCEI